MNWRDRERNESRGSCRRFLEKEKEGRRRRGGKKTIDIQQKDSKITGRKKRKQMSSSRCRSEKNKNVKKGSKRGRKAKHEKKN